MLIPTTTQRYCTQSIVPHSLLLLEGGLGLVGQLLGLVLGLVGELLGVGLVGVAVDDDGGRGTRMVDGRMGGRRDGGKWRGKDEGD